MIVKYVIIAWALLTPLVSWAAGAALPASVTRSSIVPPPPPREFRATWIATVGNSCWPSKPGLSSAQQKAELIAILDRAVALKLNAIIFQVRPACDAFYQSSYEPWSEYLTGVQGRAPSPYYDPLAFAIAEAHRRGLELHAWFNPFRAHHFQAVSPVAANHISRTHPEYIRSYAKYLWLDPGDPAVRDYSLRVVMDVVKRYDVDGVHFDDYFYPYPEKNSRGQAMDFPDAGTWNKYGVTSGLARDDWRRRNVDQFMETAYLSIKAEKPWVKVGISPFGIWRPKNPPGITGLDSYATLYSDSRRWLREGWCDYLAPQLYWGFAPREQSFPALLDWWNSQNVRHRHVWPGMDSLKAGSRAAEKWPVSEIINQISLTRRYADAGQILWNVSSLMNNAALDNALAGSVYHQAALIPASPWMNATSPPPPILTVNTWNKSVHVEWKSALGEPANGWVLQSLAGGNWATQILPAGRLDAYLDNASPAAVSVRAVSRTGMLGQPAIWTLPKLSGPVPQGE